MYPAAPAAPAKLTCTPPSHLLREPHLKQLVCLVQHQQPHARQVDLALLGHRAQPQRLRQQHVNLHRDDEA
jgi:hypothetical protein